MIDLSPEFAAAIMLGLLIVGIMSGYHIAIILGGVALVVGFLEYGQAVGTVIYPRVYSLLQNYIFLAVPLFVFMGVILESSGMAERLYDALYLWFGKLRGGLAITTVVLGSLLAVCMGIIGASLVMLAMVALPAMMKRGYSKSLATGSICASGCLGILIPPSVMLVIYGPMAQVSVGKLFMGAFLPGFLLGTLYCVYIVIRCYIQPEIAPAASVEERRVPFIKKTTALLTSVLPTVILVMSVLGVIFFGIAPPTEAASVGAVTSILLAICYRRFNLKILRRASLVTFRTCGFIILIGTMASAFTAIFIACGSGDVVRDLIMSVPGGRWGTLVFLMFLLLILGMILDWLAIIFILVPIVTPIASAAGFDPIWFAIMFCINLQASFMTPPIAGGIFILHGACPPELGVTIDDIIRGVIPFIMVVIVVLGLCIAFPQIIIWLPSMMIK